VASRLSLARSIEGVAGDGRSLYLDGLNIKIYSLRLMVFA
jgi:hypothetical protein